MPSLRERREDILPLAAHYLNFFERRQGHQHLCFSPRCEDAIVDYSWAGNLRELRNAVERAVILSPATVLEPQDLGLEPGAHEIAGQTASGGQGAARLVTPILGEDFSLAEVEREQIARIVARAPSFDAAAQLLGIDPTTLQRKRKRYGLA